MTKQQKFKSLHYCLNLIGDSPKIFKTITKGEAILFIRDMMYLVNGDTQGKRRLDDIEQSTNILHTVLAHRVRQEPIE